VREKMLDLTHREPDHVSAVTKEEALTKARAQSSIGDFQTDPPSCSGDKSDCTTVLSWLRLIAGCCGKSLVIAKS